MRSRALIPIVLLSSFISLFVLFLFFSVSQHKKVALSLFPNSIIPIEKSIRITPTSIQTSYSISPIEDPSSNGIVTIASPLFSKKQLTVQIQNIENEWGIIKGILGIVTPTDSSVRFQIQEGRVLHSKLGVVSLKGVEGIIRKADAINFTVSIKDLSYLTHEGSTYDLQTFCIDSSIGSAVVWPDSWISSIFSGVEDFLVCIDEQIALGDPTIPLFDKWSKDLARIGTSFHAKVSFEQKAQKQFYTADLSFQGPKPVGKLTEGEGGGKTIISLTPTTLQILKTQHPLPPQGISAMKVLDEKLAVDYLQRASRGSYRLRRAFFEGNWDDPFMLLHIGKGFLLDKHYNQSLLWLKLASQDLPEASYLLSYLYWSGLGVEKNQDLAINFAFDAMGEPIDLKEGCIQEPSFFDWYSNLLSSN